MSKHPKEDHDNTITVSSSIFSKDEPSTRERLAIVEAELARKQGCTRSRTRDKLELVEAEIARKRESTSTRTREKLALAEAELALKREATTTRTREKLALAEAELARKHNGTSSKTRERLAEVEKQLALSRIGTSTRTREKLALAEAELAEINGKTSSNTKEKLARVESAIKKEREKRTSTMTLENFKRKQEILKKMLKDNANVDVAFLVDCTGSMSSYIEETKNDIQEIVSNIIDTFENRIKVAFVGYRDHCDGDNRIESLGFTENIEEFKCFVANIHATGGGDEPEDVLGGLEATLHLAWSSNNKVIFHIGDAPQHGARFHDLPSSQDHHYGAEPRGLQVEDLLNSIKQMKLKYYFGKINNSTDKMIQEFKKIGGDDIVEITDMKTPNLLGMVVVDSVTKTIDGSLSRTMHMFKSIRDFKDKDGLSAISEGSEGGKTLKDYSISEAEPDYGEMKTRMSVQWLECYFPATCKALEIKNQLGAINHKWTTATVKKAADPFSEGEQRISYHGVRLYDSSTKNVDNIVLKEFKHFGKGRDRREDYIAIMETQAIAAFLANEFNKIAPRGSKEIQFLHVSVMQMYKDDGAPIYYNVEVLLPDYKDNFKKWNSNCGYVSDKNYSSTLDAFSHWTYDVTEGFLIVVDLQGVDRDEQYILTDPSIHCKEPRFGLTNLGDVGINMFFRSHSCENVCQAMGLKKHNKMRPSTPRRISAAFTKMVGWK